MDAAGIQTKSQSGKTIGEGIRSCRAGHDAQNIARLAPIEMIFIPSVGGISHSPKEYSRPEDVERGANVLLQTILGFDQGCLQEGR